MSPAIVLSLQSLLNLEYKNKTGSRSVSDGHVSLPFYTANTGLSELSISLSILNNIQSGLTVNLKSGDTVKILRPVTTKCVIFFSPRYNDADTIKCIYPAAYIEVGGDSAAFYAYDAVKGGFSTSTSLAVHWIVIPCNPTPLSSQEL